MKLADGIHQLTREQYDAITDRENFSLLKLFAKSPAHYLQALIERSNGTGKDTAARVRGRVAHLALFEPERLAAEVAVWKGDRRYGKKWDAFCEAHLGKDIVTEEIHDQCIALQRAVRNDPVASRYLGAGGRSELTLLWTHHQPAISAVPALTMRCKARLDFVSNAGAILDLKSTRDGSPEGFGKEAARYKYHAQAAFYVDGYEAATGRRLPYYLVTVEPEPPYAVATYRVPEHLLQLGRDEYRAWLSRLDLCRTENRWPGYLEGEGELEFPRWALPYGDDDADSFGLTFGDAA